MDANRLQRREFLGGLAGLSVAGSLAAASSGDMIYRQLGTTGEKVSAVGLGGYHIGMPKDENEGIRIIRSALDRGMNFLDNCWDYLDGESEVRMGKALRDGYRTKAFLMTKFDGRTKDSTAKQIDESLKRLQTDHVDLVHIHSLGHADDLAKIEAPDGAIADQRTPVVPIGIA